MHGTDHVRFDILSVGVMAGLDTLEPAAIQAVSVSSHHLLAGRWRRSAVQSCTADVNIDRSPTSPPRCRVLQRMHDIWHPYKLRVV